jgi:5S rRNA maturation endonuclease (ribonuclease M5)
MKDCRPKNKNLGISRKGVALPELTPFLFSKNQANKSAGFFKLNRSCLDIGLLQYHELWVFWGYCLIKATHKPYDVLIGKQKVNLLPGQFVFGRKKAAKAIGLTEWHIRKLIDFLKAAGELIIESTTKFSIITIVNYEILQDDGGRNATYKLLKKENYSIRYILYKLGIRYKEESGEIRFNCPYCGDTKKHLYANPVKEVFCCHKCGAKGTSYNLFSNFCPPPVNSFHNSGRLGSTENRPVASTSNKPYSHPSVENIERCHENLIGPDGRSALEYLDTRKITLQTTHIFHLGLERKYGKDWLVIPYYQDGKPVNAKYRTLPPEEKGFRRWRGGKSTLFNQDCLANTERDEVILVEGELDVIALYSQGYRNVVSTTIGANTFLPEWEVLLQEYKHIVIAYDSDEPGQKGAMEVAARLGFDRCLNVVLPTKDVNAFFMEGYDRTDLETLIGKADPFGGRVE